MGFLHGKRALITGIASQRSMQCIARARNSPLPIRTIA
jgi:enoyl-[acyl-carrier-protein] reductase (NADH)